MAIIALAGVIINKLGMRKTNQRVNSIQNGVFGYMNSTLRMAIAGKNAGTNLVLMLL